MTTRPLAFLLALVLGSPASPALAFVCGDLNGSQDVTASDALSALKYSVGQNVTIHCGAQHRTLVTSQIDCYDPAGTQVSCDGTGYDGDLRIGAPRAFTDNGDGTVTDRATGLQWEQLDDDGGVHDQDTGMTIEGAYAKVAALNAASFAGHSDWRLPNISELLTIGDLGRIDPGTFQPWFDHDCTAGCKIPACSCTPLPSYEWSSTSYAPDPSRAWALEMRFGDRFPQAKDLDTYRTRAVRGGYTQADVDNAPVFARSCADVNGNDTITAADALAILRESVGQAVDLRCILRSAPLVTGQATCYGTYGDTIACAGTGQDGELKRGVARSFTNNADGTVTDDVTGLVWEVFSDDGSLNDGGWQYTWAGSVAAKIQQLNDAGYAGHSDWRVPNAYEAESLVDFGSTSSAVYDAFFNTGCQPSCANTQCSCLPGAGSIWTSTTVIAAKGLAVRTSLVNGQMIWQSKSDITNVRGVRGGD